MVAGIPGIAMKVDDCGSGGDVGCILRNIKQCAELMAIGPSQSETTNLHIAPASDQSPVQGGKDQDEQESHGKKTNGMFFSFGGSGICIKCLTDLFTERIVFAAFFQGGAHDMLTHGNSPFTSVLWPELLTAVYWKEAVDSMLFLNWNISGANGKNSLRNWTDFSREWKENL